MFHSVSSISGNFYDIDKDSNFYYIVGTSGLVVLNPNMEEIGYVNKSGGFSCVSTAEEASFIYLGHSGEGLYKLSKGYIGSYNNLIGYLALDKHTPDLYSDIVLSLDVLTNDFLAVGTTSGIQLIEKPNIVGSVYAKPVISINIADNKTLYYGTPSGVHIKRYTGNVSNWTLPDYTLTTGSVPPITNNYIYELDSISSSGSNILGIATNSGVSIIEESLDFISSSYMHLFSVS